MLPIALDLLAILRLAKSSGGFVQDRAQCPSLPHLAQIVREKSFRFEKRFGPPVLWKRRFVVVVVVDADDLFPFVIAFGVGLLPFALGGCGLR